MGTVILACQTLQDELKMAIRETGVDFPVYYIESGLHNTPELLHQRIQDEINRIDNVGIIILVFGYCGNSLLGIKSETATLVIPRVDDCIPLLLGSSEARKTISKEMGTYFLTKGWIDNENNMLQEFERCVRRYGHIRALKAMKIMLAHYKRIMLIDTGAYPVESVAPETRDFAGKLGMRHEVAPGSPRLLHKLLQGLWDEEFHVLTPGRTLTMNDICCGDDEQRSQLRLVVK
ncbi:MAG TPA: DUF1638 domain-containing protein [Methylomusa anaerophila]|uniref:DUF1638 domain-containing protein n=1 Tax=Methylomusa anaerophila TaxID=1930071 RepID=A0A348AJ60_9FIRM|nr:DUF1638 domain-containing protein [Methylomusa anaerophila]BBB91108.1 hypothetical protein MAMMFC1_01777 [Methylomusa anaerophila]HML88985.1 DUF1638 domain-containing protein [Methylomusa anaerophila]